MNMEDYRQVADRMEPSETCRNEVLNMKKNKKITQKRNPKLTVVLIAAAVAACGTTTVLAAEYFGAFDRLANKQERMITLDNGTEVRLDKWDNNNYAAIGENAETIAEPETAAAAGLNITTDSVYCDGRSLIIGFTGELADGNAHNLELLSLLFSVTVDGTVYDIADSWSETAPFYRLEGSMTLDEGTQNSFSGSICLMLKNGIEITEPTTAEVTVYGASNIYYPEFSENVVFSVPVTPDLSTREQNIYSMEENGFGAKIYEISPAGIMVGSIYPEWYDTNTETIPVDGYVGPKYAVADLWYDENGNAMEGLYWTQEIDYGDGYRVIPLAYTDTSTITVKWVNMQKQDANGNMEVLYEYTFTIPE